MIDIEKAFHISPWLFLVPIIVIGLIVKKTSPLIALLAGTILAAIFALIFQPEVVAQIANVKELDFGSSYKGVIKAITVETSVAKSKWKLNRL